MQIKKTERESGIELLRIFAMLLIIAHHLVNNSGISHLYDYAHPSWRMFCLLVWGMWGKTAINAFVLVTGYFMCTSRLTFRRFAKLFLEISFYAVVMYGVMVAAGYERFCVKGVLGVVAWPFRGVNQGFSSSFIWLYLFIPYFNILIGVLTKRQHFCLLGCLLAMYTGASTFFDNRYVFDFVGWYMTLYFIGAALRKYPLQWMSSNKVCIPLFCGSIAAVLGFVTIVYLVALKINRAFINPNFLTEDSNKLMALIVGIGAFLVFKNIRLGHRKWINVIASTTFGVLLIHAANDGMRAWLWKDLLRVPEWYTCPLGRMVALMMLCPVAIFAVCSVLDYLRIRFIERPIFRLSCFSAH